MPKPRQLSRSPQFESPRKKRRVLSEDEEYDESQTGESSLVMSWLPHLLANPTAVQDADRYVDIENEDGRSDNGHSDAGSRVEDYSRGQSPEPSPTPERALTPEPGSAITPGMSRSISNLSNQNSKRRSKKKANTVYSDDEDYLGVNIRDDRDDDFIPDSPPARKPSKKSVPTKTKKGRSAAKEKSDVEIRVKDERKLAKSAEENGLPASASKPVAGTKRRRGESDSKNTSADGESVPATQSTSTLSTAPSEEQLAASQPPPKKKLPTIKKNKSLASTSGQASGPSTPSASTAPRAQLDLGAPKKELTLPKKPGSRMEFKSITERMGATDLDLSKPDIYANLFKKNAPTPQSAERRKELDRMRDRARVERMAMLNRTSFDLLAGHDKIARFENQLKQRNSTALYPHHLASYLKNKMTS